MFPKFPIILFLLILFFMGCQVDSKPKSDLEKEDVKMAIKLISNAFDEGGIIPSEYTCDDIDVSPKLSWGAPPKGTKSWALICDDPDAPMGIWVHWVVYCIPPEVNLLPKGIDKEKIVLGGVKQGRNDFGKIGYGGPCPPPGKPHRYFFKLYALDFMPDWEAGMTKSQVMKGIEGHIIAEAELMGKYGR